MKEKENNNKKYSLDCPYYKKSFHTIDELIKDVVNSGMDPDYYITENGKYTNQKALHLIQF